MKKIVAVLMVIMALFASAFACECEIPDTAKMTAYTMTRIGIEMTNEEFSALAAMHVGAVENCSSTRFTILQMMLNNYTLVQESFSKTELMAFAEYLTHCGCCSETVKPVQNTTYKPAKHTHNPDTYESLNSTFHKATCKCGYEYEQERHVYDRSTWVRAEGSLDVFRCKICKLLIYINLGRDNHCCDCYLGDCCENCSCGCVCG